MSDRIDDEFTVVLEHQSRQVVLHQRHTGSVMEVFERVQRTDSFKRIIGPRSAEAELVKALQAFRGRSDTPMLELPHRYRQHMGFLVEGGDSYTLCCYAENQVTCTEFMGPQPEALLHSSFPADRLIAAMFFAAERRKLR